MPSMKISLLAMASAVAAVPHYGAHSKFHRSMKPSGAQGGKPYPTGGWGGYNSTAVPAGAASPTGSYGQDTTIDVTSTSTTTVLKTVIVKPSGASSAVAKVENATPAASQCGPATITVTASEKVTVTVTPGGGAGVPQSSAAVPAESYGNGYGAASSAVVPTTPAGETTSSAPAVPVVAKTSSTTPAPEKATSAAYVAPSSAPEYLVSSLVNKPIVASSVFVASSVVASSAAPSATSGSGNSYSGSKRGLAYNEASLCKTFGSKFGFGYNWGQVENNDIGTEFIPMMHGPSQSTADDWLANVDKAVKGGSKAVMGFNEPDIAAQANLSPEAACTAWESYMNPIATSHPDVTIIGPSISNSGSTGQGLDWLSSFHDVCPQAVVQATNIHFYDNYDNGTVDRFKAQVEKAASLYGKPVWITEFGLNPGTASEDQAASFLKDCMSYLDSSDKVQGYSWFMVGSGENQLNSGDGLSAVGQVYASH